jgi:hypothetical protein
VGTGGQKFKYMAIFFHRVCYQGQTKLVSFQKKHAMNLKELKRHAIYKAQGLVLDQSLES